MSATAVANCSSSPIGGHEALALGVSNLRRALIELCEEPVDAVVGTSRGRCGERVRAQRPFPLRQRSGLLKGMAQIASLAQALHKFSETGAVPGHALMRNPVCEGSRESGLSQ